MAVRKPGVYVALSANYADDEAIMDAGEDAELLYIRMLAYCARTPLTEGWISDRVVLSRLGVMPRLAGNGAGNEPGTDAGSRAAKLCEVGLIHRDDDGYRITSWLKWNRSVEEMGRERARDAERKKPVTSGNAKRQSGTGAGKRAGNDAGLPDASPLSDQIRSDTDQIKSKTEQSNDFDDFWAVYPRRSDKGHARTAWAKAVRKADVSVLVDAARRFGEDPNLPEAKFIPLASTWLNGERWEDGPLPDRRSSQSIDSKVEGHVALARRLHAREQGSPLELEP